MGQKKLVRKAEPPSKRGVAWPRWTGFRNKTAWDFLQLLIVPLMLAAIGFWFTAQQDARQQKIENQRAQQAQTIENQRAEAERELAEQQAQDEALQAYLDQMSQLMLERKLLEAEQGDPVHTLAQARTSTVMLRLDAEHNESVTRFLINSGSAVSGEASPHLLREITLSHAKLSDAYLSEADLSGADLSEADLSGATLHKADLSNAFVIDADLSGADLRGANLSGADLDKADLNGATLHKAKGITNEQLEQQAASLDGAIMPLPPGKFSTYKFEPAFLIEVGEDWTEIAPQKPDQDFIQRGLVGGQLLFTNPSDVFDPSNLSEPKELPAPENSEEWVSWLQSHPKLDTSKPVPISVGGASGMRIDVTASSTPENYPRDLCGKRPCVPLYPISDGSSIVSLEGWKDRFVIVDVGGHTVLIDVSARAEKFDEFLPKAQKVLDSVEWRGS